MMGSHVARTCLIVFILVAAGCAGALAGPSAASEGAAASAKPAVGPADVPASALTGEIAEPYERAILAELATIDQTVAEGPFKPDWKDLERHEAAPEWFRDAKFGIYWHWGVYSVPAYGNEWYPKWMYTKEGRRSYYKHHVETYGEPDKFGYHDFVPMFKAEKFDADAWADLLKKAGAKYAGPVCEHHDGFSMWASRMTPWNAGAKGPKRDIVGELEKAIRARGMKFVCTFHHERTRTWYPRPKDEPTWPTHTTDPILRMLYANVSEDLFNKIFLAKLGEVIDKYQPDLIWFDGQLVQIAEPYHLRFLAYYFNNAAKWGRDVVVTTKKHQYPPTISVEDFEKGRADRLTENVWLTDDTISLGSWCYTRDLRIKSVSRVLHDFLDIVSKNGCLLLNISPKADGTIPKDQQEVLLALGRWLRTNGEAIYCTRPWLAYGEGPTRMAKGGSFTKGLEYTAKDIRYTRSKDGKTLYAITMGWPETKTLTLKAVKVTDEHGAKVTLLGYPKPLEFTTTLDGQMVVRMPQLAPAERPCENAFVFKLEGFEVALNRAAVPEGAALPEKAPAKAPQGSRKPTLSEDLTLEADEAGLQGPRITVETKVAGRKNIGRWNSADAKVVWKVRIPAKGTYGVKVEVASMAASRLALDIAGQTLTVAVPDTGGYAKPRLIDAGKVTIDVPGEVQVTARPADPPKWKAVNLWKLELTPAP